ncbi:MAG: hypothetical protein ABWY49_13075 [Rhizobium sp.]
MYKMIAVAALTIGMATSAMAQTSNSDASGGTSGASGTTTTDTNTSGAMGVNGANGAKGPTSATSTTQTDGSSQNCDTAKSKTGTMAANPKTSSNSAGTGTCN